MVHDQNKRRKVEVGGDACAEPLFEFQRKAAEKEKIRIAVAKAQAKEREQQQRTEEWQRSRTGGGPGTAKTATPGSKKGGNSARGPATKQEYEAEQRKIRDVYDPKTGRVRKVRGEGEIIEDIVSAKEQQRILHLATRWDGQMQYGAPI